MIIVGRLKDTGARVLASLPWPFPWGPCLPGWLPSCHNCTCTPECAPLPRAGVQPTYVCSACPGCVPGMFELMSAVAVRLSKGKMWALSLLLM